MQPECCFSADKTELAALFRGAFVERVGAGYFGEGLAGGEFDRDLFDLGPSADENGVEFAFAVIAVVVEHAADLFFGDGRLGGEKTRPVEHDDSRVNRLANLALDRLERVHAVRLRFGEQQLAVDERLKVSASGRIATLLAFEAVGQSADEGL